jgi:hypothetical protein
MKNLNKQVGTDNQSTDALEQVEINNDKNNAFNFAATESPSDSLNTYSETKKAELNEKIFHPKYSQNKSAIWIMLTLIMCLTGLCGFTTYQIYNYEKVITASNNKLDLKSATIIAGDSFSFATNKPIPPGFSKESQRVDFEWLEEKKGFANSLISTERVDGEDNSNGLIVYTTPFDNKNGQISFAQIVASKIGNEYRISNERISIANGVVLTPIIPINSRNKIVYYTAVNDSNYFVIKSYTQGSDNPKVNDKAEFAKDILSNIRIN